MLEIMLSELLAVISMGNFVHTAFKAYCGVLLGPVDFYEVPYVLLVLIPLTHWSTWSNSPWMTDLIS